MTATHALIWFVVTVVCFVSLMVLGLYEGIHSYSTKAPRRHRLRHH